MHFSELVAVLLAVVFAALVIIVGAAITNRVRFDLSDCQCVIKQIVCREAACAIQCEDGTYRRTYALGVPGQTIKYICED